MQKLHEILSSNNYIVLRLNEFLRLPPYHWSRSLSLIQDTKMTRNFPNIRACGILKRAPSYSADGKHCSLYVLKKKLCLIKANYNKTLKFNRRSELFAKCRHTEKFHAGKFKSVRDRRTRVSKKLCVEHSSIYSMTKHLLYINLAAAGGIFCLHRLSYSSWVNICTCITVLYLPHYSQV